MIGKALREAVDALDAPSDYELTIFLVGGPMGAPQQLAWGSADTLRVVTDDAGLGAPSVVLETYDGDIEIVPERSILRVRLEER